MENYGPIGPWVSIIFGVSGPQKYAKLWPNVSKRSSSGRLLTYFWGLGLRCAAQGCLSPAAGSSTIGLEDTYL